MSKLKKKIDIHPLPPVSVIKSEPDDFSTLIKLQSIDGSWSHTKELANLAKKYSIKLSKECSSLSDSCRSTLLAILLIQREFPSKLKACNFILKKAYNFLSSQQIDYERFLLTA